MLSSKRDKYYINFSFNILSSNIEEIKALNSDIGDIPIERIDFFF